MPGEYVATLIDPDAGVDATVMRPNPFDLRTALLKERDQAKIKHKGLPR